MGYKVVYAYVSHTKGDDCYTARAAFRDKDHAGNAGILVGTPRLTASQARADLAQFVLAIQEGRVAVEEEATPPPLQAL